MDASRVLTTGAVSAVGIQVELDADFERTRSIARAALGQDGDALANRQVASPFILRFSVEQASSHTVAGGLALRPLGLSAFARFSLEVSGASVVELHVHQAPLGSNPFTTAPE